MKKKVLVIGGIAATVMLVGGWALAQSALHGPGGFGPPFMHRMGPNGMGPGMMDGAGPMNGPMQHDSSIMGEMSIIHDLFVNHDHIKRTVTNLPNGIRTVTESDDPRIAGILKDHVASMIQRVGEGRDPMLPIESQALHAIFDNKDKIRTEVQATAQGGIVTQTSEDPKTVAVLQEHASQVSDFAREGMVALHNAMAKNGSMPMMGRMMMQGAGPIGDPDTAK